MTDLTPKPICPMFEYRSAGNTARICCNYGSGRTWQEWKGQKGSLEHLHKRNDHYDKYCCKDPKGCDTYKKLGPKDGKSQCTA